MNTLTKWERKWNPFREMEELQNRMSSLFSSTFGRSPFRLDTDREENVTFSEWAPLVDITEDDKEYLIKAELPDVRKEDVKLTVEHGMLNITGERKFEKEDKGKKYHRIERAYGTFTRSFAIPEDADPAQVKAEFKGGILTVHLTKSEQAKPKAIDIKVS